MFNFRETDYSILRVHLLEGDDITDSKHQDKFCRGFVKGKIIRR